jgi:hypothetical protein
VTSKRHNEARQIPIFGTSVLSENSIRLGSPCEAELSYHKADAYDLALGRNFHRRFIQVAPRDRPDGREMSTTSAPSATYARASVPVRRSSRKKKLVNGIERWHVDTTACEPYFHKLYGCKICLMVCSLNSQSIFSESFKRASKMLVQARDAKGMLTLIEECTDMHYEDFNQGE